MHATLVVTDADGDASAPVEHDIVVSSSPPPDTTPPQTTITQQPADGTATDATFAFTADEPSTFACSLDGGAFASCSSPKAYSGLAVGGHVFSVRATDTAGNVDGTPAAASWTISTPTVCDQACVDAYDAQIADLTQQLADMTASRDSVQAIADAYKARAEAAEASSPRSTT